jgi:hypothetical protein
MKVHNTDDGLIKKGEIKGSNTPWDRTNTTMKNSRHNR